MRELNQSPKVGRIHENSSPVMVKAHNLGTCLVCHQRVPVREDSYIKKGHDVVREEFGETVDFCVSGMLLVWPP